VLYVLLLSVWQHCRVFDLALVPLCLSALVPDHDRVEQPQRRLGLATNEIGRMEGARVFAVAHEVALLGTFAPVLGHLVGGCRRRVVAVQGNEETLKWI
jgi:hypothetical protein